MPDKKTAPAQLSFCCCCFEKKGFLCFLLSTLASRTIVDHSRDLIFPQWRMSLHMACACIFLGIFPSLQFFTWLIRACASTALASSCPRRVSFLGICSRRHLRAQVPNNAFAFALLCSPVVRCCQGKATIAICGTPGLRITPVA